MKQKNLILKLCLASLALLSTHALQAQTASDNYLDLANYATINQAGYDQTALKTLCLYTEYESDGVAWLTMPVHGAWSAAVTPANNGPQKWITSTSTSSAATGTYYWQAVRTPLPFKSFEPYYKSNQVKVFGPGSTAGLREVTFYVTNATAVKLYGLSGNNSNRSKLIVHECTKNADGSLTPNTEAFSIVNENESNENPFTLTVADLNENAIYQIQASCYTEKLFEIGFQARLKPELRITPANISYLAKIEETKNATLNVKGIVLNDDVTLCLNDANGVFSLSSTTVTANEAMAGKEVTVAFNSANEGTFTGSVTLTCGSLSSTVQLIGTAFDGEMATDLYLNIAKYLSIEYAGWNAADVDNLYKYAEYPNDGVAWLTLPAYGVFKSYSRQNWITGTSGFNYTNESWDVTDIFAGGAYYYTNTTKRSLRYGNSIGNLTFYVKNCNAVKVFSHIVSPSGSNGASYVRIYECTENTDGSLTASTTVAKSINSTGVAGTKEVLTLSDLDPEKIYKVVWSNYYARLLEIGFCTPIPVVVEKKTLAQLVENGVNNNLYQVTDDNLTFVDYAIDDNNIKIFAKDDCEYANPDENITNAIDYMGSIAGFGSANNYDQSNWVVIELNNITTTNQITNLQNLKGYTLKDVIGTWNKDENGNCTIVASSVPTQGTANEYTPNIFITCNFLGNLQTGVNGNNYYFVMPKPMEIAEITWAQWCDSKNAFVVPEQTGNTNQLGLDGGFYINTHLLPAFDPEDGEIYNFIALIRKESSASINATNLRSGVTRTTGGSNATVSNDYLVYPLSLVGENGGVITAVTDVRKAEPVGDDRYYNMMGQPVLHPSPGIYIHNGRKVVITQ